MGFYSSFNSQLQSLLLCLSSSFPKGPQHFALASVEAMVIFFFFFFLIIYLWLCWVFVSVLGLSLVAASGGHSSSRCTDLSLSQPLLLRSTGSRRAGSVTVAHGLSRSTACGIFPDQGSNPCPLHWQADSQPLRHQGSPVIFFITVCMSYLQGDCKFLKEEMESPYLSP